MADLLSERGRLNPPIGTVSAWCCAADTPWPYHEGCQSDHAIRLLVEAWTLVRTSGPEQAGAPALALADRDAIVQTTAAETLAS